MKSSRDIFRRTSLWSGRAAGKPLFLLLLLCLGLSGTVCRPAGTRGAAAKIRQGHFTSLVVSHYRKQLAQGLDVYGRDTTAFWMASLDPRTGRYPQDDTRPPHIPQRAYLDRSVDAPKGSTLYWDMPSVVAAINLSRSTGDGRFREAAQAYMRAFLAKSVAPNGIFLWGNHYYYDAFRDTTMKFTKDPYPVDFGRETGDLHEARPIIPAWEAFWQIAPEATRRHLLTSTEAHLVDNATGEFNRHANRESDYAFVEAGGILVYTMAWLYGKTKDPRALELADKVAGYSFSHRNPQTGLLPNSPSRDRWDKYASSTEVGLWAACLLKAADWAEPEQASRWRAMADEAMTAWLRQGFDANKKRYYGLLNVADGQPIWRTDDYPYKPQDYADIWEPLFPTHNYPISFAEACLLLHQQTKNPQYRQAVDRWVTTIREELPARQGRGAYAEHYGRVIFFLLRCHEQLGGKAYKALAQQVAQEATDQLFTQQMFRSHPGEDRYDAVDGVGILSLSLLWLDSGKKPDLMGLYF